MSNTESFIEEVTEEVQRDRLFLLMRRYGWIAVLLVVLVVGGAAYNEWQKARKIAAAEAVGNGVLAALEADDPSERVSALSGISADAESAAVLALLMAAESQIAEDLPTARTALESIVSDETLPEVYRNLATFKLVLLEGTESPVEDRRAALESIAAPGAPYRLLAEEQLAMIDVETGETDAAIARLQSLMLDTEATAGLRRRASQLIVALGGSLAAS